MASSTSGTSTSSTTNPNTLTFTGTSRYAQDFQNVITRAVAIASLPITDLDNDVTQLNDQATALGTLNTDYSNLSNAVDALTTAVGSSSYSTDITDPSIVSATVGDGAMEGTYSIQVDSLGAYSTNTSLSSLPTVTDPTSQSISTATKYTLTVGSASYAITPSSDTLYSLANAINASAANVQATVVNVGSSTSPNYQLSLQNGVLGSENIQLSADTVDQNGTPQSTLLTGTGVGGSLATYQVNGSTQVASSDSRTVTIAPGLNVTLLAQSPAGQATSITLTLDSSGIATALQGFVTAYNQASTDLGKQRGTSGGALNGDSVVYQLQEALNQLTGYYQSGSAVASLADLGVTFNDTGQLSFDEGTFLAAAFSNMGAVTSFLGDGTTTGFLANATNTMSSVEDSTNGLLTNAINQNQTTITNDQNRIATEQAQVSQLQTNLTNQMDTADALISSMEQQYDVISNLFAAMDSSTGTATSSTTTTNSLA
jgi:flagellar hook-associated protein 2